LFQLGQIAPQSVAIRGLWPHGRAAARQYLNPPSLTWQGELRVVDANLAENAFDGVEDRGHERHERDVALGLLPRESCEIRRQGIVGARFDLGDHNLASPSTELHDHRNVVTRRKLAQFELAG